MTTAPPICAWRWRAAPEPWGNRARTGTGVGRSRGEGCAGPGFVTSRERSVVSGAHRHDDHAHTEPPSDVALRVKALKSLLVEKGLVDPAALDALVEIYEHKVGPRHGARVVARAWSDPSFKAWLLRDPTAAIASLGYSGRQGEHMRVVENTPAVHNLVVCTLCSCYPWPVLGLPPVWYKSPPYRSRAVADPRGVLAEFGTELPDDVEIRVWDFDLGGAVPGPAGAAGGDRGLERGGAGGAGDQERHDRGREGEVAGQGERRAMNGGHDLGGMHGLGPIAAEPETASRSSITSGRSACSRSPSRRARSANGPSTSAVMPASASIRPTICATATTRTGWRGSRSWLVERGLVSAEELTSGRAAGPAPSALRARVLAAAEGRRGHGQGRFRRGRDRRAAALCGRRPGARVQPASARPYPRAALRARPQRRRSTSTTARTCFRTSAPKAGARAATSTACGSRQESSGGSRPARRGLRRPVGGLSGACRHERAGSRTTDHPCARR